jgi:hypothetical protein
MGHDMMLKQFFTRIFSKDGIVASAWNWLTKPSAALIEISEQRMARLAASFLFVILLLDVVGGFARIPRWGVQKAFGGSLGLSLAATLLAYLISRSRWYRAAIFIFSLGFGFSAHITIAEEGEGADFSGLVFVYIPLSLIVASSFLSSWSVLLLTGLNVGALFLLGYFGFVTLPANIGALSGITVTMGLVLILFANYRKNIERARLDELRSINRDLEDARKHLEARVTERTQLAESARAESESARLVAETARKDLEIQFWLANGQTLLADVMRGEQTISQLAENVLSHLCPYTGAQAGALFLLAEKKLTMAGSYAYTARPGFNGEFAQGEGLVGQAAADGKVIYENVPSDAVVISTGLAEIVPRQIAAVPFYMNDKVVGVIEFVTLSEFTEKHLELWNRISETLGSAFHAVQTRQRLADLLTASQQQAEELQAQEEELRAANEELQAQAEYRNTVRNQA